MLMEERVACSTDQRLTESELQAIAKAEFENPRAGYCDQQREHPQHPLMHRAANAALADHYERLIDTGVRPWPKTDDEPTLAANGYSSERIGLRMLSDLHVVQSAIQPNTAVFGLPRLGFVSTRLLIETVKRALYPAYRHAAMSVQEELVTQPQHKAGTMSRLKDGSVA